MRTGARQSLGIYGSQCCREDPRLGWDWFYNMTNSSDFIDEHYSTRIVPELQNVKAGDKIFINDMVAYDVAIADKDRAFVLLLRMRADGTDTGFARWVWNGPMNFGSSLFSYKTIMGIKRVAEALE